jgi:hypothetical protein
MTPTAKGLEEPPRPTSRSPFDAIWSSAVDAFVKTILILVMGNVALGILGGIFSAMAPSLPAFLTSESRESVSSSSVLHNWWSSVHEHQFIIIYSILFVVFLRMRLARIFPQLAGSSTWGGIHLQKITVRLSKDWFHLIVGNAFGALVSAIVLYFVGNFTGARLLFNLVLAAILPTIQAVATFIFGATLTNFLGGLISWYGDNQLRFNFWFLYVAAVCDDLGIPNLKTLARLLWSRFRGPNPIPAPAGTPPLVTPSELPKANPAIDLAEEPERLTQTHTEAERASQ